MITNNNKLNVNSFDVNNFSDYDLDYLRMQIKKNSESLEKSIQNLKRLANRTNPDIENAEN